MGQGPMLFGAINDADEDQTVLTADNGDATLLVENNTVDIPLGLTAAGVKAISDNGNAVEGTCLGSSSGVAGICDPGGGVGVVGVTTDGIAVGGFSRGRGFAGFFIGETSISGNLTVRGNLTVLPPGAKSMAMPLQDGFLSTFVHNGEPRVLD